LKYKKENDYKCLIIKILTITSFRGIPSCARIANVLLWHFCLDLMNFSITMALLEDCLVETIHLELLHGQLVSELEWGSLIRMEAVILGRLQGESLGPALDSIESFRFVWLEAK
jgi:hypothetical protein